MSKKQNNDKPAKTGDSPLIDPSQKEYQIGALLNNLPDIAWLKDMESRFIIVNEEFAKQCGRSIEEIKGKTDLDLWPKKLAESYRADDRRVIREGKAIRVEEKFVRTGGKESWIETIKVPIKEASGKIVGTVGIARDITDQKRLADRQLKLKDKAIETSVTAIAMANLEGLWTYVNPAFVQLWGYKIADEVMKKTLNDFFDSQHSIPDILKMLLEKEQWHGELNGKRKDGSDLVVQASLSLVKDENNKPVQIMASFLNVTDQKRADVAIRNAQKLESLGVLAGGMAHDFNNLLVGVLGNASLALNKLPQKSEIRAFLEDIILSAENASKLTAQLLAYSGRGKFVVQPINISQQINKIERLLRHSVSKNTELIFQLEEDLPLINADAAQIHQVIVNLVTNASESLEGKPGKVTIATGVRVLTHQQSSTLTHATHYQIESGRYVFLRVSDTGCGINEKAAEKIFDPFFTTKFAGRGLGLSAVQGIVMAHCGTIHIESKPGKGTTIEVYFPVTETETAGLPSSTRPKTKVYQMTSREKKMILHKGETPQMSGTVLIVDDENVVRTVASHILEELGLKIVSAENGFRALEIYHKKPSAIDVILLDMTMPGMDGVETFRELKKINPNVRVILTSGYSADEVKLNFKDSDDVRGFLEKPFTSQALSEIISEVLLSK